MRFIEKKCDEETFIIWQQQHEWIVDDYDAVKQLLDKFFYECNYTFLHYKNTIDYCRTEIAHYLLVFFGIYIADDLIWYALFSEPYSLYNYSQNLTNLKYKRQYDYGYLEQ